MKALRLLVTLLIAVGLFFLCLLFVVGNAQQVTLDLLFSELTLTFSLGGLLLLTLVIGLILGVGLATIRQWLIASEQT